MLNAIVFDFDGTIIDTEAHDYGAWVEIYDEHGVELPLAEWRNIVGTANTSFDPHRLLEELTGRSFERAALRARRHERLRALVEAEDFRPGVLSLIEAAHAAGVALAVASSGTRDWVEGHLSARGLRSYFGAVCTANDVAQVKPDPALYHLALERLGVKPENAVAIEDSRHGMVAAKRAGMRCVVVPNDLTRSMDFTEADLLLTSLAEIDLAGLQQLVAQADQPSA